MAKVMISIPEDLLAQLDLEAERRQTSRSALLQLAAKKEIGLGALDREELIERARALSAYWNGPTDVTEFIRQDRDRDR